ncbi:MAG: hypothetical protein ACYTGC_15050, partial [Planctomycetota bacterium]
MRTPTLLLLTTAILATPFATTHAQDQSRAILKRHFDRNLEKVAEESRRALPGLLRYPQEVRESVLVLCQYPELVIRLDDALDDAEAVSAAAAGYPEDAAPAAAVLSGYPDILDVLEENLVATSVVGRVYGDDPNFIRDTVNRLAEQSNAEHEAAVDAWATLLKEDADTQKQFQEAAEAYAEEVGYEAETEEPGEVEVIYVEPTYDSYDDDFWYYT